MNVTIRPATAADAPLIAWAIVTAIGPEIIESIGRPDLVEAMFADLARRDDTQYSWRNVSIAVAPDGHDAGVVVAYDGAGLDTMRRHFFEQVAIRFGRDMSDMGDETDAGEVYLDTLAVLPQYRRQGVANALIGAARSRARAAGKPLGLLVEKENHRARRLYDAVGFVAVGERPFAYTMMDHMQLV